MSKFFIKNEQKNNDKIIIIGQDVNHIKNVLRKKINDEIIVCNSETSKDYICKIKEMTDEKINCEIMKSIEKNTEANVQISIFQGLPKADKMELVIQKSVELGVHDITPVEMQRCVVKLDNKDKIKKIQRWQKISEVAAKQSGRNIIPNINNIIDLKNVCNLCQDYDIVLVAYESEKENKLRYEIKKIKEQVKSNVKIAILIGPEGGIDEKEIEILRKIDNVKIITLGKRILRTETVALNMLSILMYELED